jgi:hypothetical protein
MACRGGRVSRILARVPTTHSPMHGPSTPKGIATLLCRIAFGLSIAIIGIAHYQNFDGFTVMVTDGFDSGSPLGFVYWLARAWAYIMPALLIIGGALLATNRVPKVAAWTAGLALASIPVGMLLKMVTAGVGLDDTMPAAMISLIWIIAFLQVIKGMGDGSDCGSGCNCNCGCGNCTCSGSGMGSGSAAPKSMMPPKKDSKSTAKPATSVAATSTKVEATKPTAPAPRPASGGMKAAPKKPMQPKKQIIAFKKPEEQGPTAPSSSPS